MKRIAFILTENGVDGRSPTTITDAFWDEAERDAAYKAKGNNAPWFRQTEIIVDVESATKQALSKLNGLDKLLLLKI